MTPPSHAVQLGRLTLSLGAAGSAPSATRKATSGVRVTTTATAGTIPTEGSARGDSCSSAPCAGGCVARTRTGDNSPGMTAVPHPLPIPVPQTRPRAAAGVPHAVYFSSRWEDFWWKLFACRWHEGQRAAVQHSSLCAAGTEHPPVCHPADTESCGCRRAARAMVTAGWWHTWWLHVLLMPITAPICAHRPCTPKRFNRILLLAAPTGGG